MTPLHVAAESGWIKIVDCFVNQRADVNIQDHDGVNKCCICCSCSKEEKLQAICITVLDILEIYILTQSYYSIIM